VALEEIWNGWSFSKSAVRHCEERKRSFDGGPRLSAKAEGVASLHQLDGRAEVINANQ